MAQARRKRGMELALVRSSVVSSRSALVSASSFAICARSAFTAALCVAVAGLSNGRRRNSVIVHFVSACPLQIAGSGLRKPVPGQTL